MMHEVCVTELRRHGALIHQKKATGAKDATARQSGPHKIGKRKVKKTSSEHNKDHVLI
jgi:hypothetical protein